jgi:hypothetical protein
MSTIYKLTVGIISYNRPVELARTIKSLLPLPPLVEVVVCDDKSPKITEIIESIKEFAQIDNIRFISNETNLGYDRNLFHVIELSNSEHVLLLGDDDYLDVGSIQNILNFIVKTSNFQSGFIKFSDVKKEKYSRNYGVTKYFDFNQIQKDGSFIYNSILFSGLIFNKKSVLDSRDIFEKYFQSIYIQVAIFCQMSSKHGSYFIDGPGVIVGGDGENGFGFNDASVNLDFDLKDRSTIISNLTYHKRLFDVLKKVDSDINQNISKPFCFEYKLRSIKALFTARKYSREYINSYWKELAKLNIDKVWQLRPFYLIFYILPVEVLIWPLKITETILVNYRKYINNI